MKTFIRYILIVFLVVAAAAALIRNYEAVRKFAVDQNEKLQGLIAKARQKGVAVEEPTAIPFQPEMEVIPVKVFEVKRTNFKDTLPVLGTIRGFREIDLKFEVSGVLESFNFEEGEMVEEGDIIANLNQRDALLKLEYTKIELDKNEKLFNIGAIAKPQLEKNKLEYQQARNDFEKTNLYAPIGGFLGTKHSEEGEYVSQNDKIAKFVDIRNVYAEFGIIEKDISKVALGQEAEVFVDAYPGKSYKGSVEQISPLVEGRSRTQALKIKIYNPEDKLKPGMFARGVIATYEAENALIVPTTALRKKEEGFSIYVIHKLEGEGTGEGAEFGQVEIKPVEIKYMASDFAEIGKGIAEGELVAVEVREELQDKAKVEITEVQESPF